MLPWRCYCELMQQRGQRNMREALPVGSIAIKAFPNSPWFDECKRRRGHSEPGEQGRRGAWSGILSLTLRRRACAKRLMKQQITFLQLGQICTGAATPRPNSSSSSRHWSLPYQPTTAQISPAAPILLLLRQAISPHHLCLPSPLSPFPLPPSSSPPVPFPPLLLPPSTSPLHPHMHLTTHG